MGIRLDPFKMDNYTLIILQIILESDVLLTKVIFLFLTNLLN